jgi:hypothetical protein
MVPIAGGRLQDVGEEHPAVAQARIPKPGSAVEQLKEKRSLDGGGRACHADDAVRKARAVPKRGYEADHALPPDNRRLGRRAACEYRHNRDDTVMWNQIRSTVRVGSIRVRPRSRSTSRRCDLS